jgi:hypothetical protein
MINPATISQLAKLRNQIEQVQKTCDQTLNVMSSARDRAQALATTTPFLADCAKDLEALAGVCRQAAAQAGHPAVLD